MTLLRTFLCICGRKPSFKLWNITHQSCFCQGCSLVLKHILKKYKTWTQDQDFSWSWRKKKKRNFLSIQEEKEKETFSISKSILSYQRTEKIQSFVMIEDAKAKFPSRRYYICLFISFFFSNAGPWEGSAIWQETCK